MKTVAVFCGASLGYSPAYKEIVAEVGAFFAKNEIALVYGGGKAGLMGVIANAVLDGGGEVYGVIPDRMVQAERAHHGVTKLYIVESMHARKSLMAQLADGFIALPGGLGTLDELFEILTWNQLGIISKPVGLLNFEGYFNPLIEMIEHIGTQGFLHTLRPDELRISDKIETLINEMNP